MAESSDKRFWEAYLVRYLVPSVVSGICLAYLCLAGDCPSNNGGVTNFKSTIEWLSKQFNTIMFIVWGVVSFAVMYLFSGITMGIHALRSWFVYKTPFNYYYDVYLIKYSGKVQYKDSYIRYRESFRHFREHGTAFEVSLYLIIVTLLINPIVLIGYKFAVLLIIVICLLGTYLGNYFGIYLELALYNKAHGKTNLECFWCFVCVHFIIISAFIWDIFFR